MNIIQIQNDLKNVSDQALINYVQNPTGHVPSFLALGELQRRKDMRADYVKNNPPKSTVAQDLEQQSTPASGLAMLAKNPHLGAPASQGVANLPTGEMFSEKNFATGGIVAFADNQDQPVSSDMPSRTFGNDFSTLSKYMTNLPSYLIEPFMKLATRTSAKVAYDTLTKNYPNMPKNVFTQTDDKTASTIPGANVLGSQASADTLNSLNLGTYIPPSINQKALDDANKSPMVKETNPFDNVSAEHIPIEKVGDLGSYADEFKKYIGTDPNRAKLEERLTKMDTKAAEEERMAPWMALAQAGFGMAAGKSPYALSNIGEGSLAGIKSYGEAKDKLEKLEEKRFDLAHDLAKAQRAETIAEAEYGAKSKEAAKSRALTAEVHNKSNDNALKIAKIQASVTSGNKLIAAKDKIEDNVRAKLKDLISAGTISISSPEEYDRLFKKMLSEAYQQYGITGAPAVPTNTTAMLQPAAKGSGANFRFGY